MSDRKVILYISMSLDGFLSTKDDSLDFLSVVTKEGEDYGYGKMMENCDTYIVGRKTYEVVLSLTGGTFPQADLLDCYVITRTEREPENGVNFYSGDISELIAEIKKEEGKNIYCDGGGQIVRLLMENDLIDEYMISMIPVVLGDGKRLFLGGVPGGNLELIDSKSFDTGLVQLHYKKK